MKKIQSLFMRNYDGDHLVRPEVVPGCEWVLAGEGTPTEKLDGMACAVIGGVLYKRYDRRDKFLRKGKLRLKPSPPGWIPCEESPDPETGHWPGWVPVGAGPEDAVLRETLVVQNPLDDGTYEFVGPKVQGNPYRMPEHVFYRHGAVKLPLAFAADLSVFEAFKAIAAYLASLHPHPVIHEVMLPIEGIVWHHADGRMAKIKRRDFGLPWPVKP